ncbi:arsenite efflux ATPase [Halogeometricum pallidum JCM 14848]|uniref:Arsenite efflux ATPase n=1 Tax=Halogeometricum pallidum JCM 14848 TaxID=1227487 RepID=M0D322_HALPD|nr:arsenical pump-driving ATPase [Halogeometricum pallidum]ELZ29082.1 arsenite efflux ATPase [Halogeometricum pallidum JCM 14848]
MTVTPAREIVEPSGEDTEFVFFSGKGGVGKSTVSCATAQWLAESGRDTLLVTTDPAPNLSDIFGQSIGHSVTSIGDVENLSAIEIDPDKAAEEYRQRTLEPMRQLLDDEQLETVEEQLDSPCVEEIAAFDKFVDFMDEPEHDVVVFDTAPTGHTIRLMELPSGWSEELDSGQATCIGPAASMQEQKEDYEAAVDTLSDDEQTSFVFVGRPEEAAIDEIERSSGNLADLGIQTSLVVVNGYLPESVCEDPFFEKKRADEQEALASVEERFADQPIATYPLQPGEITGTELLADVADVLYEGSDPTLTVDEEPTDPSGESLDAETDREEVMERLRPQSDTRYLFFTGKGGVGKSTMAATTATTLANEGYETLVVTTDPASHLQNVFGTEVGHDPTDVGLDGLHAARIDQERALEEYKTQMLEQVEQSFDGDAEDVEAAKEQVREELESPCAEEMAALEKFVGYFDVDGYDVIVFDTAPTGHTLRLLELPSDWKGFMDLGSLTKEASDSSDKYDRVIETMRDPERSSFVFVMYPEYTPMMEAWRASEDLRNQVGIETSLVAVNYLLPDEYGNNAFFESRREQQRDYLEKIDDRFEVPMMLAPLQRSEPTGLSELEQLGTEILGAQDDDRPMQPEIQ